MEYLVQDLTVPSQEIFYHCKNHVNMGQYGKITLDENSIMTYNVTANSGKFYLDGVESPNLILHPGFSYKFLQEDATNNYGSGHPLYFQHTKNTLDLDNVLGLILNLIIRK